MILKNQEQETKKESIENISERAKKRVAQWQKEDMDKLGEAKNDKTEKRVRLVERLKELTGNEATHAIVKNLTTLRSILAEKNISKEVRNLLTDAEVVCTITGIKPASYIQVKEGRKFLGIRIREGLTKDELEQFLTVLKKFDIEYSMMNFQGVRKFESQSSVNLINIYNKNRALKVMENSNLFNEEEIKRAKVNFGNFLGNYLNSKNLGTTSAYRAGVIYGYPVEDVKDMILKGDQKGSKDVTIRGPNGSIEWKSFNYSSKPVKEKIVTIKTVLNLQKNMLA